jgi:hydroxymethylglutaryl-CoA lyase
MMDRARIFEVGPRDGLQNEKHLLPRAEKVWLIEALVKAGIRELEAGAFVRADRVPQMAESELLHEDLSARHLSADLYYLVPNLKGLERAISKQVTHIAVFTAVSNTFNQKNIGMTVQDSFKEIGAIAQAAKQAGIKVRAYVSTVWGCPFEGRIPASQALPVLEQMLALPVDELSIGDTIGVAAPNGVSEIVKPLLGSGFQSKLAVHFHDTRGTALANALRSFELGIRTFDSSLGGLGGCPFAPGASGNLATEDLAYMLKELGVETGVNYEALCQAGLRLTTLMGYERPISKALQAFLANCNQSNAWDS